MDKILALALPFTSLLLPALAAPPDGKDETPSMKIHRTADGVRFGVFGEKKAQPAPTLFVFALGLKEMQTAPLYTEVGRHLAKHGFLYVALDPPCHGEDVKPNEPPQIRGWRDRIEKGDPFIATFTSRGSSVLDQLVKEGYTEPDKVAACGISRGGFLAFHFAAAEPRVKAAAGFAPVTNLLAVTEFAGLEKNEDAQKLALVNIAPKLAGRSIWISIGNNDQRVSTDDAIAFSRKVVAASAAAQKGKAQAVPVHLTVGSSIGHSDLAGSHERAAVWIREQLFPKQVK
jgi:dienelactone hydrolase